MERGYTNTIFGDLYNKLFNKESDGNILVTLLQIPEVFRLFSVSSYTYHLSCISIGGLGMFTQLKCLRKNCQFLTVFSIIKMPSEYSSSYAGWFVKYQCFIEKSIISDILSSFSSGLDSATIRVMVTVAQSLLIVSPLCGKAVFLFINSRNRAAIRLHLAVNGYPYEESIKGLPPFLQCWINPLAEYSLVHSCQYASRPTYTKP